MDQGRKQIMQAYIMEKVKNFSKSILYVADFMNDFIGYWGRQFRWSWNRKAEIKETQKEKARERWGIKAQKEARSSPSGETPTQPPQADLYNEEDTGCCTQLQRQVGPVCNSGTLITVSLCYTINIILEFFVMLITYKFWTVWWLKKEKFFCLILLGMTFPLKTLL